MKETHLSLKGKYLFNRTLENIGTDQVVIVTVPPKRGGSNDVNWSATFVATVMNHRLPYQDYLQRLNKEKV